MTLASCLQEQPAVWHPKIAAVHDHWLSLHPAPGALPGRQHFDPLRVPELLPNLWLMDVQSDPLRLRFRLVGTAHVTIRKRDITGQWLDELFPGRTEFPRRAQRIVESRQPDWRRGAAHWDLDDSGFSELENICLPLARDGRNVDMLMCLTMYYRHDGRAV